jgi:xanthine dehydrogenase YagR molybdenum-binding subunit
MRAPVEGPRTWALESAMDQLAVQLGMEPLDLRLANYAEEDPANGTPWSSKKMREAYAEGARLFGWRERGRTANRDGHWLVGCGMASCTMGTFRFPSVARVRLFCRRFGAGRIRLPGHRHGHVDDHAANHGGCIGHGPRADRDAHG